MQCLHRWQQNFLLGMISAHYCKGAFTLPLLDSTPRNCTSREVHSSQV